MPTDRIGISPKPGWLCNVNPVCKSIFLLIRAVFKSLLIDRVDIAISIRRVSNDHQSDPACKQQVQLRAQLSIKPPCKYCTQGTEIVEGRELSGSVFNGLYRAWSCPWQEVLMCNWTIASVIYYDNLRPSAIVIAKFVTCLPKRCRLRRSWWPICIQNDENGG